MHIINRGRWLTGPLAGLLAVGGLGAGLVATTSVPAGAASKGTVNVMIEGAISGPVYALPEMVTGAKAGVARLNADGGVDGHKVNLIVCDDQGNPNLDASCGRQAVADHVVAAVGSLSEYDQRFIPALAKAKIPYFGSTDINPIDHTSPVSFPIISTITDWTGMGQVMAKNSKGCKKGAVIGVNGPTVPGLVYMKSAFLADGGKTFREYLYPATVTTFTSYVADAITNGAQCVAIIGGPQANTAMLTAIKKSGTNLPVVSDLTAEVPSLYTPVGFPSGEMKVVGAYYAPGSGKAANGTTTFVKDMKAQKASGESGSIDTLAENSYQGVMMFAQAAKGLKAITGPAILAAVPKNMTRVATGLTPPFNMAKKGPFPGYPQIRDTNEVVYNWTGSKLSYVTQMTVTPAKAK